MRYVHRIIVMKNIIQRTSECWISHLVRIREAAKKNFLVVQNQGLVDSLKRVTYTTAGIAGIVDCLKSRSSPSRSSALHSRLRVSSSVNLKRRTYSNKYSHAVTIAKIIYFQKTCENEDIHTILTLL